MANETVDFPHGPSLFFVELEDATHGDLWQRGSIPIRIEIRAK